MNQRAVSTRTAVVLEPQIVGVAYVLNVGMGFQLTPDMAPAWSLILSGFDADVLKFAALEYTRQRRTHPTGPADIGQIAGWLQRAIEDARPKYSQRDRAARHQAPDQFVAGFVAACGNDTRAFIEAQANAPRAVADAIDEDRADLLRRIELTRTRIASGGFVDADYGRDYLAHLEAQL